MWKRIFGGLLFVWMTAAAIGSFQGVHFGRGVRGGTELVGIGVCVLLAIIGLVIAISPAKTLKPPDKPSD
jgi:hypothetical protein